MPFIKVGDRVRYIGKLKEHISTWPKGVWLEKGIEGTVTEYHPRIRDPLWWPGEPPFLEAYAVVKFDNGVSASIQPKNEGERWERVAVSPSTYPLVLERFPYPAPEQMGLDIGGIGELKVNIPPPRGVKLPEGAVRRTSDKHDKAVEHLGYHSVSLSDEDIASLETKLPTDVELIDESQKRLRETKVMPDEQLTGSQLALLNLSKAIAEDVGYVPPGGIFAAVIPPASDKVRTAGLYGTRTGALYLSVDMLSRGRDAIDTHIHELGHHLQYIGSGEAEDLTPGHAQAMMNIADKVIKGLESGRYDKLLRDIQY